MEAAALFETIIVPGFYLLAGAAVALLLFARYTRRKQNDDEA